MKIFIDAGHNNNSFDTGAMGIIAREQDICFLVSKKLAAVLNDCGIETKMSRNIISENLGYDVNSSLNIRCKMANDWNADYFVSIHTNAFNKTLGGIETYAYMGGGKAERLAESVQSNLISELGLFNRGVKYKDLAVLRKTNMPAILVELGFIDNPQEEKKLLNENFQKKAAIAIAKGILNFVGIEVKNMEHWAQKSLENLVQKGIITDKKQWEDFDSLVTKGLLLAALDKILK